MIPTYVTKNNPLQLINNILKRSKIGKCVICTIDSLLHRSTVQIQYNSKTTQRSCHLLYALKTVDKDEAKEILPDQRILNGAKNQCNMYFAYCSKFVKELEGKTFVNTDATPVIYI